jgi:predicted ABC-type ATPase
MIEKMRALVREGKSFAFETTCSGKSYSRLLEQCKHEGWRISLFYFWLPSPEMAIARVSRRVRQGGHSIPPAEIYDNSDRRRVLIAEKRGGLGLRVHDPERWALIKEIRL